jgi:hypothetical protein
MSQEQRVQRVLVIFDTNAIFSAGSEDLLNSATTALIAQCASNVWVHPEWILPDTVWHERVHQLYKLADGCDPALNRIARLTGQPRSLSTEVIRAAILSRLEEQRASLGIRVHALDCQQLDLECLRLDALYRRPPFSEGEEKGFKDALIVATIFNYWLS